MVGDRRMIRKLGSKANSHTDRQTGTRKYKGKIRGRGQKAEAISGDSTRQAGRSGTGRVGNG